MPEESKGTGNRNLDLSSSRLFYRELDVLPMLSEDEESALAEATDGARMEMLQAVMSVPSGCKRFLDPLRRLADGGRVPGDILDTGYWSVSNGVMERGRRKELRDLLASISCDSPARDPVLGLRLNWQRVEEIGDGLFSAIERLGSFDDDQILLQAGAVADPSVIESDAVDFESSGSGDRQGSLSSWMTYPLLTRKRREMDLIRAETGNEPEQLVEAGRRFRSARARLDGIMDSLVEANLRLVISVTRRFPVDSVMEEMDLIQEGCQGLLHAARRFDFQRGYRFSTYAVWWIRRYIATAVTRDKAQTGVPPYLQKRRAAVQEEIENLTNSRQRYPTSGEIARELDMTEAQVDMIQAAEAGQLSVDRTYGGEDGASIGDFLRSGTGDPLSTAIDQDLSRRIEMALNSLTQRERSIITLRFGLFDGEPQSLESVSRIFGVSRERIRQIQSTALARLRDMGLNGSIQQEDEKG